MEHLGGCDRPDRKRANEREGGTQGVGFCFDPLFQFRHIQN